MTGSRVFVVTGGQWGSEGKGAVAGRIAADLEAAGRRVVGVRVGGPNAGHTVIGKCPPDCLQKDHEPERHPWRLRQVPVAAVTAPNADLVIAQGSEIDPGVLEREIRELDSAGYSAAARLTVDRSATVIEPVHARAERAAGFVENFGSTAKGIGMARMDRLRRTARTWAQYGPNPARPDLYGLTGDTARRLYGELGRVGEGADIVVEGTQGYGLGLHAGKYPFCTSGDCRAVDFLAQAGISPWQAGPDGVRVVVCFRPYPIRVAGNSGHLHNETSWEELGLPPELTTVTQKVRRVGTWDANLVRAAMRANGAPSGSVFAALAMADQVSPDLSGADGDLHRCLKEIRLPIQGLYDDLLGSRLAYIGTGPDTALVDPRLYR